MANQSLVNEYQGLLYSQLGFTLNSSSFTTNTFSPNSFNYLSSSTLDHTPFSSTTPKPREDLLSSSHDVIIPPLFSPHRPTSNIWEWGEKDSHDHGRKRSVEDFVGTSPMKMKKIKTRRKVREPRFCFKTMSDVDVLDDGYKWRKYGQKVVKNTLHPRSYYRCTQEKCRVKKRVERLGEDPRMVITTYEGRHIHSPSHDLDESQITQPFLNNFFC
ncbi:hypothetical protein KSS87_004097 [Heliosperma pusillum]|nr:hypothetical protein KSS87_004097 [Heliosperma pusillum]